MKFWSRAVMAAAVVAFALSTMVGNAASPPAGSPGRPSNLKATAGDTHANLSWKAPTGVVPIDHYTITRTPGTGTYDTPDGTTTSYAWPDLTNGTTYTFRVAAVNAIGTGTASLPASAKPRAIPPGRPTNLGATQTGAGQVRLDWTPPATNGSLPNNSDNSATIDRYTVTINPGGTSNVVPASTLTYAYSGLADNLTYQFAVSATNSRPMRGAAALVYAPLPTGASLGLQPTAGGPSTSITVTGQLFLKNESITLYWDLSTHVAGSVVADDTGAFTKVVKPFRGDKPKVHKLCASVQPHPCASFTLQGVPTPTPGITPSPIDTSSPTPTVGETPQASGVRPGGGGGISGLDIITRPPFVFLPIIAIIGILGVLLYWLLSRGRQMRAAPAATVVHRATRPDYMAPFPTSGTPPLAPPPPAQASAWDAPIQSAPPVQPYTPPAVEPPPPAATYAPTPYVPPPVPPQAPPPPAPPAVPDEPPDLPQPSD
jgi:Fibronectin type III domain